MPSISVVIPVYNAAQTVGALCDALQPVLDRIADNYEIILVDDGSKDTSASVIADLARTHSHVTAIELGRNYGQHNALLCGIRAARMSMIVTMDDDLQHPPTQIEVLLTAMGDNHDVVYGVPKKEQHGLMRNMASRLTKIALQGAIGVEAARNVSAFRLFRTNLRDAFDDFRSPSVSIDVLLTWATARFTSTRVEHQPRAIGESNYTLRKLVAHAFNLMTGFSALPLKFASIVGFGLTLFGIGILAFVLIRYFTLGTSVPGFAFLASIITIFSGAQLFALGIFGEYLARMHFRTLNRPVYHVREHQASDLPSDERKAASIVQARSGTNRH
ncbi:MAG: glycosyltransferase family 2 protein [Pseudomonadota bacterium]